MSLSIGGPGPALPNPLRPDASERPAPGSSDGSAGSAAGAAAFRDAAVPFQDARAAEGGGVDASPSARVDPELWALLGGNERAFYLRNSITSPATYGPAASPGAARPGARVGVRLDVRA